MDELLKKLKDYIKARDLTIYKLTELSDLSENTIYNWYNKGAEPSLHALYSICKILDISMCELFAENDKEIYTKQEDDLIKKFRTLSLTQKELIIKIMEELKD